MSGSGHSSTYWPPINSYVLCEEALTEILKGGMWKQNFCNVDASAFLGLMGGETMREFTVGRFVSFS